MNTQEYVQASSSRIITIRKGLDLPIQGRPKREIQDGAFIKEVALLGSDYVGIKPFFAVKVGDYVKKGQVLFHDRKIPKIKFTSPGSGKITAINRGLRRVFQSIVIALDHKFEQNFPLYTEKQLDNLDREKVISLLLESGEWTALRTRPYSQIPDPDTTPHSLFIKCIDTNPLAPSINRILGKNIREFINGVKIISKLTDGKKFITKGPQIMVPKELEPYAEIVSFEGPHPAGNIGTHMHFLDPVHKGKVNWHINFQDVIAIGKLFVTGKLHFDRIIAISGPATENPRLITCRLGASTDQIINHELREQFTTSKEDEESVRVISGSVLNGHIATGPYAFLGRYHQQITVLYEPQQRELLGWLSPGLNKFSVKPVFLSKLIPKKTFSFGTSLNGSPRAMVPIGMYEKVMPLDILPTFLLRSLLSYDLEKSEALGCLELDEEDLALCTFVCPGKIDYGVALRKILTIIESEG